MRKALFALLLAVLVPVASAQKAEVNPMDAGQAIAITLEPLGENDQGQTVARVSFRFATPPEVPAESGLFLQGSILQGGKVLRNFRIAVPLELQRPLTTIQAFAEGPAEVEARLILPMEEGMPAIVSKATASFTVAKANQPYVASEDDGAEAILAEGVIPEVTGAVKIRAPKRDVAPNLFIVNVDVQPPVKRVEFWVEGKKVLARNAPPYSAELDLGTIPKRVEVRVVGYDAQGRYVDADAFIVNERDTPLEVKITRTQTPDGVSHFKLSIQNPKNTAIKTVILYAGANKLYEWKRPPYALSVANSRLGSEEFVRASVIDDTGYEAADLLFLNGDRYIEEIEVNLVELPVSVNDAAGNPVIGLEQKNFSVSENGKPQKLSGFNFAANLPISVGVLVDHSGSMEKRMADAKTAASKFFRSIIRKGDRAFIGGFAMDPTRNSPFVSDLSLLDAQVTAVPEAGGGTSLYDAIVTGLYRFRNVQGRKALIVITDGDDTTSRLSYDDMLQYARSARVPLYFIGIGFSDLFGGGSKMKSLAAESGGVAYMIRDVKQLDDAYAQLEKDLRSQYLLSYHTESTKKDTAYRTVEVKVDRPDAKVRTIRGFIP